MSKKVNHIAGSFIVLLVLLTFVSNASTDIWALFGKTKFTEKLNREFNMYFLYPQFPPELKAFEGKEITVSGFFIPLEVENTNMVVLSKFPMAQCFFCGGAGPESILVAYLKTKPSKKHKTDEIIKIKGRLKLNDKDIEELNFILQDAVIVP
jgi:uncharacterized membrane protein YcgQ (UPF0703/DUF1980 family)